MNDTLNNRSEFEKSFEDFLYSQNYDRASDMIFLLARSAFLSGYLSAERNNAAPNHQFEVIFGDKKEKG
jgi:hypothetical protein